MRRCRARCGPSTVTVANADSGVPVGDKVDSGWARCVPISDAIAEDGDGKKILVAAEPVTPPTRPIPSMVLISQVRGGGALASGTVVVVAVLGLED